MFTPKHTVLLSAGNKKKDISQSNLSHCQCLTAGCGMRQTSGNYSSIGMKGQEYLMSEINAINVQAIYSPKKQKSHFSLKIPAFK